MTRRRPPAPIYRDPRWPRIRKLVLIRDGYRCQIQTPICIGLANSADHIIPWRELPPSEWYVITNLRAACMPCQLHVRTHQPRPPTPSRDW